MTLTSTNWKAVAHGLFPSEHFRSKVQVGTQIPRFVNICELTVECKFMYRHAPAYVHVVIVPVCIYGYKHAAT